MTTATNVSARVIESMLNHLVATYSADEACEILIEKYPSHEGDIYMMGQRVKSKKTQPEVEVVNEVQAEVDPEAAKLSKAVKAKTAKTPKAAKAPKAQKESKMDKARDLYQAASDKSRKAMIEVFGKELGMSKAAASTYFYTVKG